MNEFGVAVFGNKAKYVAHAHGRVGQKAVNSSGAKPGSAVLCWLVVRFVAVMIVIN